MKIPFEQKWIKPSAIVATIVLGVGFWVWDYHFYPLPEQKTPIVVLEPSEYAMWKDLRYSVEFKLHHWVKDLRIRKSDRIQKKILLTIQFFEREWKYVHWYEEQSSPNLAVFHENGSITINGSPHFPKLKTVPFRPANERRIINWFSFTRRDISPFELKLKNQTTA